MAASLAGPSVLGLVADMTGPSLWRVLQPFTALQKRGYRADWDHKDAAGLGEIAPYYAGFVLPRMSWTPGTSADRGALVRGAPRGRALRGLRSRRRPADGAVDGALRRARHDAGQVGRELEAERFERIWAVQQCDGVTVSTQPLARSCARTRRPVVVVPNAIDVRGSVASSGRRADSGLTIGWAGGRRPDRDVALMAEAWGRIAARYPDVRFVVQGHLPGAVIEHVPEERLTYLPWMPLERTRPGSARSTSAARPSRTRGFNACKSPNQGIRVRRRGRGRRRVDDDLRQADRGRRDRLPRGHGRRLGGRALGARRAAGASRHARAPAA
jgi:glycosyltransferase involved in cell wall biosynthesis